MTLTSSHITLQGITLWALLPEKMKEYYKKYKWDFLIINLFAGFPDVDVFFKIHREATHGIIIPIIILFLSLNVANVMKKKGIFEGGKQRYSRLISLSMVMWILHIIIDLNWDAVMLFWPLDNHFYDFDLLFKLNAANLLLVGIIPQWQIYSKNEGSNMFFINLSQMERENYFGQYLNLSIPELTVEVLLAVTWLAMIVFPLFRNGNKKKRGNHLFKKKIRNVIGFTSKRFERQLTGLGFLILMIGVMYGPSVGKVNSYNNEFAVYLANTNSIFDPTLGFSLENEQYRNITLQIKTEITKVNYTPILLIVSNATFYSFFQRFENLTSLYYSGTLNFSSLETEYNALVDEIKEETIVFKQGTVSTNFSTVGITLSNELTNESNYYVLYLLTNWTENNSFMYKTTVNLTFQSLRTRQFKTGIFLLTTGLILIIIDQTYTFIELQLRKTNFKDKMQKLNYKTSEFFKKVVSKKEEKE